MDSISHPRQSQIVHKRNIGALVPYDRFWSYTQFSVLLIIAGSLCRFFFFVQYLPLLGIVGRITAIGFFLLIIAIWIALFLRSPTVALAITAVIACYSILATCLSFYNQHWFVFASRNTFISYQGWMLLILLGYMLAKHRRVLREPRESWPFMIIGGIFSILMLNYIRFIQTATLSLDSREMVYEGVNTIILGYTSGILGVICYALSIKFKDLWKRVIFGVCAVLMFVSLILLAARGALLFYLVTVVFISVINFRFTWTGVARYAPALLVAIFGVGVVYYIRPDFIVSRFSFLTERLVQVLEFLTGKHYATGAQATSGRFDIYMSFLERFPDWWFTGLKGYGEDPYPHNLFLELGVRYGLLAIPVIVGILIAFKRLIVLCRFRDKIDIFDFVFVGLFVFGFLQSMTSMNLDGHRAMWIAMGYLIGLELPSRRLLHWRPTVKRGFEPDKAM